MSGEAFTREELAEFFRMMLENVNRECGKADYALAAMDVDYDGALSRDGDAPILLANQNGVCIRFSFKPIIKMKEGESVG